jgi:hypothetical protein
MMMRTTIAAVTFMLMAGAATAEPRLGDRWSYSGRDEVTGDAKGVINLVVVHSDQQQLVVRQTVQGKDGQRTMYFTPQWARIDDEVWKFAPHDGLNIPQNLQVGQQWRIDHTARNLRAGNALTVVGMARVAAVEAMATPAGTFEAYRIEVVDRRNNSGSQTAAEARTTIWYAPVADRWVKRTFTLFVDGRLRESITDTLVDINRAGKPSAAPAAGATQQDQTLRRPGLQTYDQPSGGRIHQTALSHD